MVVEAPYSDWAERWQAAVAACERLGGDNQSLTVAPPATLDEVLAVEADLGVSLPASFRRTLLEFSSHVEMRWHLPTDLKPPGSIKPIFSGGYYWNLATMSKLRDGLNLWLKAFSNLNDPYDRVWHNKLALADVSNGDVLAFDLSNAPDPPVVYLSHDDGEGHGYRLGQNFADFMDRWSLLGCPGGEDWQMMPFLNDPMSGLDPYGENAQKWRQWFGLDV